jgi:hypothetical protein
VATVVVFSKIVEEWTTGVFISRSVEGCSSKECRPGLSKMANQAPAVIISKSVEE